MEPKLPGSRFVLAVNNLKLSADFYIDKLGFKTLWKDEGWHSVRRDNIFIMLGECPDDKPAHEIGCHSYYGYFEVENIDELYKEYQSKGVEIPGKMEDKPWKMREFSVRTIDGHRIMFGQEI